MIRRVWTAYIVECIKALRSKATYLGPILVLGAVACMPLLQPLARDEKHDYGFIAFATPAALNLLGLILILTYCASLVSGELASGVLRFACVRPVLRHELLIAKILLGLTYGTTLMVIVAGASWALVVFFGDVSGVEYGGEVLFTSSQMATSYVTGMILMLAPIAATVSYAVFISTLTRSSGTAIGASLGIWIFLDAIKNPLGISSVLFSTYFEMPWQVFANRSMGVETMWTPNLYWCLATSAIAVIVFAGSAIAVFERRNLHA